MLKTFGISALLLGSLIAVVPQVASARDHDDDREDAWERYQRREQHEWHEQREWREHEQREWREHQQHEWREHERSEHPNYDYRYGYQRGYYDRFGYWHAY
jgi:hypothetical protein